MCARTKRLLEIRHCYCCMYPCNAWEVRSSSCPPAAHGRALVVALQPSVDLENQQIETMLFILIRGIHIQ